MNELQKAQQTIGVLQNCLAEEPILNPRGIHILDSVRLHNAHLHEAIETDRALGKAVSAIFSDRLMDQLEKLTDKAQQHAARGELKEQKAALEQLLKLTQWLDERLETITNAETAASNIQNKLEKDSSSLAYYKWNALELEICLESPEELSDKAKRNVVEVLHAGLSDYQGGSGYLRGVASRVGAEYAAPLINDKDARLAAKALEVLATDIQSAPIVMKKAVSWLKESSVGPSVEAALRAISACSADGSTLVAETEIFDGILGVLKATLPKEATRGQRTEQKKLAYELLYKVGSDLRHNRDEIIEALFVLAEKEQQNLSAEPARVLSCIGVAVDPNHEARFYTLLQNFLKAGPVLQGAAARIVAENDQIKDQDLVRDAIYGCPYSAYKTADALIVKLGNGTTEADLDYLRQIASYRAGPAVEALHSMRRNGIGGSVSVLRAIMSSKVGQDIKMKLLDGFKQDALLTDYEWECVTDGLKAQGMQTSFREGGKKMPKYIGKVAEKTMEIITAKLDSLTTDQARELFCKISEVAYANRSEHSLRSINAAKKLQLRLNT